MELTELIDQLSSTLEPDQQLLLSKIIKELEGRVQHILRTQARVSSETYELLDRLTCH